MMRGFSRITGRGGNSMWRYLSPHCDQCGGRGGASFGLPARVSLVS